MTDYPESAEVISSLSQSFITKYRDFEDAAGEGWEDLDTEEADQYLSAINALITSGHHRTFRVCSDLAWRSVRFLGEVPDSAEIVLSDDDDEDPAYVEQAATAFLTAILHADFEDANLVLEQLVEDDEDDLTDTLDFVSLLVVSAANAGPGNIFYRTT